MEGVGSRRTLLSCHIPAFLLGAAAALTSKMPVAPLSCESHSSKERNKINVRFLPPSCFILLESLKKKNLALPDLGIS